MNVEELLQKKELEYIPKGNDFLVKCLNPEHDDSNPSMRVDQITGIFNCFSCQYRGSVFTHFGEKPNQMQMKREFLKRKIVSVRAQSLGLPMPNGYFPYQGTWRGISPQTYKDFRAFTCETKNDDGSRNAYAGRVVFPLTDGTGDICAFIGRDTGNETPKYLIQPAKARLPLFPATATPINGTIMIVEGIYDLLNLYDKGLRNVMCCFGSGNVSEEKLSILQMKGVDNIDIFLDNDTAGNLGAETIAAVCDELGLQHRRIKYGNKEADPGSLTENQVLKLKKNLYD
jgi:DNA primase